MAEYQNIYQRGVAHGRAEQEERIAELEAQLAEAQKAYPSKHEELMADPEYRLLYAVEAAKADIEQLRFELAEARKAAEIVKLALWNVVEVHEDVFCAPGANDHVKKCVNHEIELATAMLTHHHRSKPRAT